MLNNLLIGNPLAFRTYYVAVKFKSFKEIKEKIMNNEYAQALAKKWVILNQEQKTVEIRYNKHLQEEFNALHLSSFLTIRMDYFYSFSECISDSKIFGIVTTPGEYVFNTSTGELKRKTRANEVVCKNCGRIYENKSELRGNYCTECLLNGGGRLVGMFAHRYSYHSKPEQIRVAEKIDQSKVLTLGAEIERDYTGNETGSYFFAEHLNKTLLKVCENFYNLNKKELRREHNFESDGSLNCGGVEWITYPATYKYFKQNKERYAKALEIFKQNNFEATKNAGNHIHINRLFFGGNSDYHAAKIALIVNEYWEEFLAITKRDRRSTGYCTKPEQAKDKSEWELALITQANKFDHTGAVNMQHQNTIELRFFGAVENIDDLLLDFDIAKALARVAKNRGLIYCKKIKFEEILKFLTDKKEHLPIILERLNTQRITTHNAGIKKLIEEVNKKGEE